MTKNEISQTQKENTVGPKCEVPGEAGFTETERGRGHGLGEGGGGYYLMGTGLRCGEMK